MTAGYPTVEQLQHLVGHAERRSLTPVEAARLRAGLAHLAAAIPTPAAARTSANSTAEEQ